MREEEKAVDEIVLCAYTVFESFCKRIHNRGICRMSNRRTTWKVHKPQFHKMEMNELFICRIQKKLFRLKRRG